MAEALVSAVIEQLLNVITDNAKQEWRLVTGVDKQIQNLQSNFQAIQCVVEDAEEKQIVDKGVKLWLARLKAVAYDMEDVVDEWKTAILKLEIDRAEKVCSFLSCFAWCRQIVRRHDIAAKIKGINEELDVIAQEKDSEKINSAKFLLVLDDVWTDRYEDWVPLKATFKTGLPGSKILVTTRKRSVARVMESSVFDLEQLSDEVCWLIVKQLAFRGKDNYLCENLEDSGREIAKKCNGLPLAAKTLGSLLWEKETKNEWQNILNSKIWELNVAKEYIFKPLLLSYYDLPSTIRPCLLYCSIFPKDFNFEPTKLIRHWIAHGYVSYNKNSRIEEETVGEEYFKYLASRSFFQDFKKDRHGNILECKMHDMVHDFVQYLTNEEVLEVEVSSSEDVELNLSSKKAHHLRVTMTRSSQFPVSINGIEKLRSFIFMGMREDNKITWRAWQALFQRSKCLRVLVFHLNYQQYPFILVPEVLPNEVEKLIHLRCLDLSRSGNLKKLPEEICELYNLQYLNLSYCGDLEKLPEGIGKLINLRSLDTWLCYGLQYYPKGIGKLTSLKELTRVIARVDGNNTNEFGVGDLENLNLLRGSVDIRLSGNVINVEEFKRAKLHNKIHLQRINFGNWRHEADLDAAIKASNPLPNLKIGFF
ncbi:hypothetical protein PTKIN_Ptkin08bG0024100 [Pterospermum kingtungense]